MARRLDIELTSSRDDGTWTWRAAGAREPRGVVEGKLLGPDARVGDVYKVEAEFDIDGISVLGVVASRQRQDRVQRIELVSSKPVATGVTTSLVAKPDRRGRSGPGRGPRNDQDRPRRERRPHVDADERRPRIDAGEPRRSHRPAQAEGSSRPTGPSRPTRERPPTRGPRITPSTTHRDVLFATLQPEQRPIAEQLALGGLPAVRRALAEQQSVARAAGQPIANGDAIIALAEQLLGPVKEATWLDRAETTEAHLDGISLRELRATVTSAAPKDERGRTLLASLREALDSRLTKLRTTWEEGIGHALDEHKVLQALRLSIRPPEPSARFPAALVGRLAEAASQALAPTTPSERWMALVDAAAESPVRRLVKPLGLPTEHTSELRKAAAMQAGRIPALAGLLGLSMPPPPRPIANRPQRPARVPRPAMTPAPTRPHPVTTESSESTVDESLEQAGLNTGAISPPAPEQSQEGDQTTDSSLSDHPVATEPVAQPSDESES